MPYPPQPGLDKRNFFRNEEKLRKYTKMQPHFCQHLLSAPTRGPWIEIPGSPFGPAGPASRPPHGGRGLKYLRHATRSISRLSAPTRGPWIEMPLSFRGPSVRPSAPTRGPWIEINGWRKRATNAPCRPPHGGRGLKFFGWRWPELNRRRPPHGGRGLKCFQREKADLVPLVGPHTGAVD